MSFPGKAEVIIIGSGIMGISTAYYLVRHGCHNVVLLEGALHLGGQTTQLCGGGFRCQFSSRINIELSLMSMRLLQELSEETDVPITLRRTGYLFAITQTKEMQVFKQAIALQKKAGVRTEWLSSRIVRELLPMMCLEDVQGAAFNGDDGMIDPQTVMQAYLTEVKQAGAMLLPAVPVTGIHVEKGRVYHVVTPYGHIATSIVVNAAGPWAGEVCRLVNYTLPVVPVRHQVLVTNPVKNFPMGMPTVIFPGEGMGFRHRGERVLIGITDKPGNAGASQLQFSNTLEANLWSLAIRRFPALQTTAITHRQVGLYEMTPDGQPIVGQLPGIGGFYCIAGFNGHGFMHAPACGSLLSQQILDGQAHSLDISSLRIERFSQAHRQDKAENQESTLVGGSSSWC